MIATRWHPDLLTAAGLAVLLLAGCSSTDTSGEATPGSATASSSPGPTATATATDAASPSQPNAPAADVTLDLTVAGGKVNPSGKNVPVKAGQTVRVTATSDVADTIHVHGYDKELAMKPGQPISVTFGADNKGSFEIETHESGKLVAKLIVS